MPSDELVDRYAWPPSGPYVGGAVGSSGGLFGGAVGSSNGLFNASISAPEVIWPMIPEPHLATVANPTVNAFYGSALSVGANANANACPPCTDSIPNGTYYTHTFEGFSGADTSSWLPPADHGYADPTRRQCDENAYLHWHTVQECFDACGYLLSDSEISSLRLSLGLSADSASNDSQQLLTTSMW